jgi:hypothetical protein
MASITITHDMFAAMSDGARAELVKMLTAAPAAAPSAVAAVVTDDGAQTLKKRGRKPKKVVDPNAPPKEKRPPNSWILFSGRVEKLIRDAEKEKDTAKDAKMRTVVVKQFASFLKKTKADAEWTDEDILAALDGWTPPVAAEPAAESVADAEPASDAEPATEPAAEPATAAAKKRGPKKLTEMTAEERAAHDAKIAERKAKKAAAPAAEKDKTE